MCSLSWDTIDPRAMRLPPGDKVFWYAGARPVEGVLTGHNAEGQALIVNQFNSPVVKPFTEIRLFDPFNRLGPNWTRLPPSGRILRPPATTVDRFRHLLSQYIPPGPRYIEFIKEIWFRGFEVFVVGGTVRDVIAGNDTKDVDIVTTMPLNLLRDLIEPMFRYDPSAAEENGYVRIGGSSKSGDPFIDLKVFSDSLPSTEEATFGVDFSRDVAHRDFACNALYYDAINEGIIDPTGVGVVDAQNPTLTFICESGNPYQYAQIYIRAVKFSLRGFAIGPTTMARLSSDLVEALPSMRASVRVGYVPAQLLGKSPSKEQHPQILKDFKERMEALGHKAAWERHFEPIYDRILK
jgi:Poly A polymerase head domain